MLPRGSEYRPSYHANENFQPFEEKLTAKNSPFPTSFLQNNKAEWGACNRPSHLLLAPPLRKFPPLSFAPNHCGIGCCRSGVVLSILRAPSPLISPDGDSAPPTGACPIDDGVTP